MMLTLMSLARAVLLALAASFGGGQAAGVSPAPEDPALRAAVERFFATQQAEDIPAYLALWSRTAERPQPAQLKFVFDSGDDTFSDITILRVRPAGDRVRARVAAHRQRAIARAGGGAPILVESDVSISLTYVKEDGDWKLVREAPAADDLAAALLEAPTAAARDELLKNDPDLVGPALIGALSSRGSTAAQLRQDYAMAAAIFERVLEVARISRNKKAEGEALQNIANALYFQRNYEAALDRYNERLALERDRGSDEGVAASLGGIATVRYSYAEYGAALDTYREALAIQERLGDLPSVATTLVSTGNVLYLQGDYDAAVADYRRSRELNHKMVNTDGEARALEGLGRVFTAQGNYAPALAAFAGVLDEGKARGDRRAQGSALQHIGEVQFRLGNLDTARSSFEASRAHYEALGDQPNAGRLWQAIALTDLVASRFGVAEQEYRKSNAICAAGSDPECVAHAIVGLAFALSGEEKFSEAAASYQQAIAAFTALNHNEEAARAQVGLSQAWLGKGDLDAALDAAVRAHQYAVTAGSGDVLWRALVAEARVLRRKGDRASAAAVAEDAVAAAVRLQQIADEHPGNTVPPECAMAFATLAVIQAESGDAAAALLAAERMRAFALRATLAPHERDIARGMTPEERVEERDATAQVISLDAQLARQRALPKRDGARLAKLETQLREAVVKRNEARTRLFSRVPELVLWRGLLPAASAPDFQKLLADAPGTVLLQFVVDDDDLVVITARLLDEQVAVTATTVAITRHAVAERVARVVQASVLRDAAEWKRSSADLGFLLPDALSERLLHARSVVIVPDGTLWRVPFEALPLKDGYLGDTRAVSYAGSLTTIALRPAVLRRDSGTAPDTGDANQPPRHRLVTVAAPEVAPDVRDLVLLTAPGWTLRAPAGAVEETARIAAVYGDNASAASSGIAGKDATEARVRTAGTTAEVLHIAAPFRINAASPLFSAILLGSSPLAQADAADDGMLEAREIMNVSAAARTVVLSDGTAAAMHDALGAAGVIEWAWLAAGVPSMVLNRWTSEETAAALLADFHKRLAAGAAPAEALNAARAAIRSGPDTSAPYYWAGWMAVGR